MKQRILLWLARFLLRFIDGYHIHKDPVRRALPELSGTEDLIS